MGCIEVDILWKELLWDSPQPSSKRSPSSPDFRQIQTKELLGLAQENLAKPGTTVEKFHAQKAGHEDEVLKVLQELEEFHDSSALVNLIKVCGNQKNLHKGTRLHANILKTGLLEKNIYVGTALLRMYAKCGTLAKAQEVFNELPARDVASWNALIAGYAEHGLGDEALNCFERMRDEGLSPNAVTFVCISKACGSIGAVEKGEEIHAEAGRQGIVEKNIFLGTALVDMYARCGALAEAQDLFDKLLVRNLVSWNALIAGYAQHGHGDGALNCYGQMQDKGFSPDSVTFACILKACGSIGAVEKGEKIHAKVGRQGLLEKDIVLGTALVDMYAKCGALAKAQEVFDELPVRTIVSWNVLIAGHTQHGHDDEALKCFGRMQDEGLFPNAITFACILKACGSIAAVGQGEEIHAEAERQGLLENNIVVGSAVVDMYAKCGVLAKAQAVFDELPVRNMVSWNALIAGYANHGLSDEALRYSERMQDEGLSPDTITFVCILKACGSIGAAEKGEEIHARVDRQGLLGKDVLLSTALVDMYAKCGVLLKAQEAFDKLAARDVAAWNALIAGYAQVGKVKRVLNSFRKMIEECIEPNVVNFVVLLNVCNHAGLVLEGEMYYDSMSTVYCIIPTLEHHVCMVDLFSRAGHFDKAVSMIEKVPSSDCLLLWSALSGACQKWVNVELGRRAYEHAVQLNAKNAAPYVCLGNIYAAAGMQEEADKDEALRMTNRAWKLSERCWWTDVSSNIHSFTVEDKNHPWTKSNYAKLKDISNKLPLQGYIPRVHLVSQAISDDVPCGHIEKLAIAFALINTPEGTPIHVTKNMCVCGDCHFATLLISKIEERRIRVKDGNSIHIFEEGRCLCKE